MAGTGDLRVLRLCRHLRLRVGATYGYVVYGSHMAIAMSIGLLFLGRSGPATLPCLGVVGADTFRRFQTPNGETQLWFRRFYKTLTR